MAQGKHIVITFIDALHRTSVTGYMCIYPYILFSKSLCSFSVEDSCNNVSHLIHMNVILNYDLDVDVDDMMNTLG